MATKSASTETPAPSPSRARNRRPRPETAGTQGQLRLVIDESRQPWKLDDATRAIGREGVARAREVLRSARSHPLDSAA